MFHWLIGMNIPENTKYIEIVRVKVFAGLCLK